MKRVILLFTAYFLLLLSSCTLPAEVPGNGNIETSAIGNQNKVSDYFPLIKDIHISYKGTGNEFASLERYVDYVNGSRIQLRDMNPGTVAVNVYEIGSETVKRVYSSGESYSRVDCTSLNNNDEIIIKSPIKVGTEWDLKGGAKRSITAVDKDISIPLGNFKALEVTTEGTDSNVREYYVKGMGFAARVFSLKGSEDSKIITEAEKYEKNIPFEADFRIFYPDSNNEKVYYTNKRIDLYTGNEPYKALQEELKSPPSGSSLVKVLTSGVSIRNVKVDRDKDIVTVDFSKELLSEMNLGSGPEGMMLNCIADTFGWYYQVRKVGITVEGKAYSSGHIIINPGEYLTPTPDKAEELK